MIFKKALFLILLAGLFMACRQKVEHAKRVEEYPAITPDYTNISIPFNIAPLNFMANEENVRVECHSKGGSLIIKGKGKLDFPAGKFRQLLAQSIGDTVWVTLFAETNGKWTRYKPFYWKIEEEPIDSFLTYRLIEPGYEVWNKVTLEQRNITNFQESAIADNNLVENSCMNCHIPNKHQPSQSFFHIRGKKGMTVIADKNGLRSLDTKIKGGYSSLIYGDWAPSGKYIAFSTNAVLPSTHSIRNKRAFVYDTISDVVVLQLEHNTLLKTDLLMQHDVLETFPAFSADGSKLFFCSAKKVALPEEHLKLQYSICSVNFDATGGTFGEKIDTLFNGPAMNRTATELKVSPDGKYLAFGSFSYGTFALWHNDAKIYLYNLSTGTTDTLPELNNNANYANAYHSWSTNSRWLAFASKRDNGLYSKVYFSYIDKDGKAHKPFVLPQKDPERYNATLKSYNVPELIRTEVSFDALDIEKLYHKATPEPLIQ